MKHVAECPMGKRSLIRAALALGILVFSWLLIQLVRLAGLRFRIAGEIEIINACDGRASSLPSQVEVDASLNDAQGQKASGRTIVQLRSAPGVGPNTARVVGNYSITDLELVFPAGFGAPANWDDPILTLVGGGDVCASIPCPAPSLQCKGPRLVPQGVIPFLRPTTRADIRILCVCA